MSLIDVQYWDMRPEGGGQDLVAGAFSVEAVTMRTLCKCGHTLGCHRDWKECSRPFCLCEEFRPWA